MFGFFNKTIHIRTLTGLLLLQNDLLKDLVNIIKSRSCWQEHTDFKTVSDAICGEWGGKDLGICLSIRNENNNYFVSIRDLNGQPEDYRESYPIREYKDTCYFILDSYAIFIEHDQNNKQLRICGNLSMVRMAADRASYPAIPLDINPN